MKYINQMVNYLWIFVSLLHLSRSQENNRSVQFTDIAPLHYDYLTLPKINGERVEVNITIRNLIIRSVDEDDKSITVALELWQYWFDHRLKFPPWSDEQVQILDSGWLTKLWVPHIYFVNSVEGKVNKVITPSSFFWLSPYKKIFYCCKLIVKLICDMNLNRFPHDEQVCGVKMASAIFKEEDLVLNWFASIAEQPCHNECSSLQQFQVVRLEDNRCLAKLSFLNVSCLEKSVVLKRRSGYYIINVYIPTVLIVVMSMLTFWIPPDAVPARITLGVTSLLTIITKQQQASLPNVSYIVALNVWLSSCIGFVFLSLLEYAVVISICKKAKNSGLVTGNEKDHKNFNLPMVLLRNDGSWTEIKVAFENKQKLLSFNPKRLDYASRIIFPLSFIIFCIVYWHYYN